MGNYSFNWQSYIWRGILIRSKIVFNGFANNKAQTIKVGSIDAIDGDNKHLHGYYMVGFLSSPNTLQENKTIDGN